MPTYQFEAMDATGSEIKDVIDAPSEEEAQATIRQMGYFVTKIAVKMAAAGKSGAGGKKRRGFAMGGAGTKHISLVTKQLSILQDAGLPILRSIRILEVQQKGGRLKNALGDVGDEIESGATLSEAMAKSPKQRDDETIARLARDVHVKTFALAQMVQNTPARTAVSRLADLLTSSVSTPLAA